MVNNCIDGFNVSPLSDEIIVVSYVVNCMQLLYTYMYV